MRMKDMKMSAMINQVLLLSSLLLLGARTAECAPATTDFLPPILPEEYSLSFTETHQTYDAYDRSKLFNYEEVFGNQFWSLANLAQRAEYLATFDERVNGITNDISDLTVTNFSNPSFDKAMLVADLVGEQCHYWPKTGNLAYQGHEFYRYFVMGAILAGIEVEQTNVSNWIYNGTSYGPVNIWSGTPPPLTEGHLLTYSVVFPENSNHLLSFEVNGTTEQLDFRGTGKSRLVYIDIVNIRTNYTETNKGDWPRDFFDVVGACPFEYVDDVGDRSPSAQIAMANVWSKASQSIQNATISASSSATTRPSTLFLMVMASVGSLLLLWS